MRRGYEFLISVSLLVFFLEVVTSLSASLRLIDISKLPVVGAVSPLLFPVFQESGQFADQSPSGADYWIFVATTVIVLTALVFWGRRRRDRGGDSSFWNLLGVLLGVAYYLGIVELFSNIELSPAGSLQRGLIQTLTIISTAALVVGTLIMVALALLERSRNLRTSAPLESGGSVQEVRKLLQSIRERIYSLPEKEVYRDSVISCYSAMLRLLARYGAADRPSFTPQELETSASESLDLGAGDIYLLTRLFEKARYADVPITKREAEDSLDSLDRMAAEVSARVGSVRSS